MKRKIRLAIAISLCCLGILGMATYSAISIYSTEYQLALAKTVEEQNDNILFNEP